MTTNTESKFKVAALIVAFVILAVSMILGLSQPAGDLRTWCGVAGFASFFWLIAAVWYSPK